MRYTCKPYHFEMLMSSTAVTPCVLTSCSMCMAYDIIPTRNMICMPAGSAHAVLGPYWQQILGKSNRKARQCSPRGGDVLIEVDDKERRVLVSGPTRIVSKGHLLL